jgi:hypothetical protein
MRTLLQSGNNVQCDHCNRMRPVCNGNGSLETGFTSAQCQGCADVFEGNMTLDARAALRSIKCGIKGAWKNSENETAMGYARVLRDTIMQGHLELAATWLKMASHHQAATMAIQYVITTK